MKILETEKHQLTMGSRTIDYYFTPAESPNRPILIILHGQGYVERPSQFQSPLWNVVCPIDNFGYNGMGCWFLGERGDFFWLDAMKLIIQEVREKSGSGRLHFWGSSMGGYGGLVHGKLNNATAVYANVAQTHLLGSTYSERGSKVYFEPIFGDVVESRFNDLKVLFQTRSRTKYFLCFNQLERGNYFAEQGLAFVSQLNSIRQKFYLEVRPLEAHGKNHGVSEALALFRKYAD